MPGVKRSAGPVVERDPVAVAANILFITRASQRTLAVWIDRPAAIRLGKVDIGHVAAEALISILDTASWEAIVGAISQADVGGGVIRQIELVWENARLVVVVLETSNIGPATG